MSRRKNQPKTREAPMDDELTRARYSWQIRSEATEKTLEPSRETQESHSPTSRTPYPRAVVYFFVISSFLGLRILSSVLSRTVSTSLPSPFSGGAACLSRVLPSVPDLRTLNSSACLRPRRNMIDRYSPPEFGFLPWSPGSSPRRTDRLVC